MQAIARANHLNEGKNNGLIVDYWGILKHLRKAQATFDGTQPGGGGGETDPAKPDEELLADLAEAIAFVRTFLDEHNASLSPPGHLETTARNQVSYQVTYKGIPNFFRSWKHQLPVDLKEQSAGPGHRVHFLVGNYLDTAAKRGILHAVTLALIVIGQTYEDVVEFKLNGKPLSEDPDFRLYPEYKMGPGSNAFQGRYGLRYDLRSRDWIRPGWNEVEMALRKRTCWARQPFEIYELNFEVKYRVLQ